MKQYGGLREQKEKELKQCQAKHSLRSCMPCMSFIGCKLRSEYVTAVYMDLNPDMSGGFEF